MKLAEFMAEAERSEILRVLVENQWNVTHTALALGIHRGDLYKRLGKYGIERPPRYSSPGSHRGNWSSLQ